MNTRTMTLVALLLLSPVGVTEADESELAPKPQVHYDDLEDGGVQVATEGVVKREGGTVSCWVRFDSNHPRRDHMLFSTDDSRFCLYVDTYFSRGFGRQVTRIAARAGGNRRVVDSAYRGGNFPEASILVDNDGAIADKRNPDSPGAAWSGARKFDYDEWHHVTMTWEGKPKGKVKIYLNGSLVGEKPYHLGYDDGSPTFESYAVGFRPSRWRGESTKQGDLVPTTGMRLQDGGIAVRKLGIYDDALDPKDIVELNQQAPSERR